MKPGARVGWLALLSLCAPLLINGCSEDSDSTGAGGTTGGDAGPSYGASACGACVASACASERSACEGDPSCAVYLTCLEACPPGPDGNVDTSCEAQCPQVEGSSGQKVRDDFSGCRLSGEGAACPACGIDAGAGGAPGNPILNQTCEPFDDPNPCFVCEMEHCCETYSACKNDPACDAFATCIKSCPDATYEACIDRCAQEQPDGEPGFTTRLACIFVYCVDGATCGSDPVDPCVRCVVDSCADEYVACQADVECSRLYRCTGDCTADVGCYDACRDERPNAIPLFDDFALCTNQRCAAECGES